MKLFIKLRNKYFTILASLALMILSSIGLFNLCTPQSVEASMINFDNENTITITNGSFSTFSSSSSYPYTLTSYSTSGNKTPDMKTGAIDVTESVYAKNYSKYGLSEYGNPGDVGANDNYVLMINTGEGVSSNYTYTSSDFTLPANGHYYVTVSAKTLGDNAVASVYLTKDGTVFEDCVIENITSTTWSNYTFFISTNSYESVTLKFNMQIGNRAGGANGCVLFDELHAGEISQDTMIDAINTLDANSFKTVDYRIQNAYKAYNFDNIIVELPRNSKGELISNELGGYQINTINNNYFQEVTSGAGSKTSDIANGVITLTTDNTYITYKGQSETLDANSTYRFSIWVKASAIEEGSAYVELNEIVEEGDDYNDFMESESVDMTPKSSSLMISSVTTNSVTDGYVEYSIYVRTGALSDSKVQFSFGLGADDENATGNVSFKRYLIERVPYSAYSAVSTSDTKGTIDISSRLSLNSDEYSNYTFDQMQSESFDGIAYPATPTSWTKLNSGNGVQLSGVVNLSSFDKVMDKYSYINTMATPSALNNTLNNNVLMIYNGTNSVHSYTSTSKSLTANKYYKITAFVNTYISGNSANGATIVAKSGTNVLGMITDINTKGNWQKVEFYINTPSNSVDVSLELALGYDNKLACGYAFFDNILIESADEANDFSNRFAEYEVNKKVELDLTNPMLTLTTGRDYNTAVLYSGTNKGETTVNAGIVDLNGDLNMIASSKHQALTDVTWSNKNVLAIASALDVDSYYEYVSVINYTFASGTYYKVSFDLFTDGIGQEEKEEMYDNGVLAQGVNIELTNLENAKFSYITSDGAWTHYEVYIGINSSTTSNLKFSLGSEFSGCYGKAFLGNIVLEEVEEADFTATSTSATTLKVDTVAKDETEDDDTTSEGGENNFNWAYIPTIATFLAIVVAVIGIFIRRNVKFKKRVKTGKVDYDRDTTVMQNKYRRLAQDARDKEVRELTKEYNELINLRAEYEEKYKDALSRLRTARLANRDGTKRHEIMAIEHEVKHISKEVARFGVQVNNYENEIEFMQTEAYLIDLEKRMMREDNAYRNTQLKEAGMSEEERAEAIAKREAKQHQAQLKVQAKADKLAEKQAKLEAQRKQVQDDLQQAKELDEKYIKEQELKQIKLEGIRVAKEQAKAQKELEKLEKAQLKLESEKALAQESVEDAQEAEQVDNTDVEDKASEDAETATETQKVGNEESVVDSTTQSTQTQVEVSETQNNLVEDNQTSEELKDNAKNSENE